MVEVKLSTCINTNKRLLRFLHRVTNFVVIGVLVRINEDMVSVALIRMVWAVSGRIYCDRLDEHILWANKPRINQSPFSRRRKRLHLCMEVLDWAFLLDPILSIWPYRRQKSMEFNLWLVWLWRILRIMVLLDFMLQSLQMLVAFVSVVQMPALPFLLRLV